MSSSQKLAATIGRNTVFGIAASFAQLATRLFTVPIVIAHMGVDGYGIWAIVVTISAYLRFGSVGIKCAFQKYVAEATGNEKFDRVNRLLSTGSAIMLALSMAGLIPIVVFSRGLVKAAGVPSQFLSAAAGSITLLTVTMVFSNSGAAYEAIVMGAHRIDLTRRFTFILTIVEAIIIILLVRRGYGLLAMSAVMATSEVVFVVCCFVAARRVLPVVRVSLRFLDRAVVRELVTFAGSYQLVNILEVVYQAILPIAVLRTFGAHSAGIYAIAGRLLGAALLPQEALLLPVLSGGSLIFGQGSKDHMRLLLTKAFKTAFALTVMPLAFLSVFGTLIVFVWTGQTDESLTSTLILLSIAGLFKALSMLQLVLY